MQNKIKNYEVIVVSNNSSNLSINYLENLKVQLDNKFIHISIQEEGKGIAIKRGIEKSMFKNILFMDADSSVEITEFDKFVDGYELRSPFVIGNRKNELSQNLNSPVIRRLTGYLFLKINQILLKINIEDSQCGFKAIDKAIFTNSINFFTNGFSFDIELILLAQIENVRILEVPVRYIHNSDSKVKIFSHSLKMFYEILKIRFNYLELMK